MIIADTGFWIALINRKDKHHGQAKELLKQLTVARETLITTCAVMTETCHWLVQRMGIDAQEQFMSSQVGWASVDLPHIYQLKPKRAWCL